MAHLSQERVAELREYHHHLREVDEALDEDERDEALSPATRDQKVADKFGVSVSLVRRIVMGLAHAEAGGPIDQARRARRDLYRRERVSLGETEARRRLKLRAMNIDPAPKVETLVQRVTIVDSKGRPTPAVVDLQPGQSVRVELVPIGGDR